MFKLGLEKAEEPRDQIANICWIIEKAGEFQKKTSTSISLTMLKPLTVCNITNCGKPLKRWNIRSSYLTPDKPICVSRSNS